MNNTTQVDMSSKSPNMDDVSEFEISPSKMSSSQTDRTNPSESTMNKDDSSSSFL